MVFLKSGCGIAAFLKDVKDFVVFLQFAEYLNVVARMRANLVANGLMALTEYETLLKLRVCCKSYG